MKVKINTASPLKWYKSKIGQEFEVGEYSKDFYIEKETENFILKSDCEIIPEKRMYTISEIKEQGIWVKCTGEDANRLKTAFGNKANAKGYSEFYKYADNEAFYESQIDTPSTYIEFSQVDFEEKEVESYECIKNILAYSIGAKIKDKMQFNDCANMPEYFKPIYKTKFKVGGYIISVKKGGNNVVNEGIERNIYDKIGLVMRIKEITKDSTMFNAVIGITECNHRVYLGDVNGTTYFRLATKEEIEKTSEIKIGEYKVDTTTNIATINGTHYNKHELTMLSNIMSKGQIKSLNCGCSGQYKVDLETINKIINKLN